MLLDIDRLLGPAETDEESLEIMELKMVEIRMAINSDLLELQDKIHYTVRPTTHNVVSAYKALEEVHYVLSLVSVIKYDDQ